MKMEHFQQALPFLKYLVLNNSKLNQLRHNLNYVPNKIHEFQQLAQWFLYYPIYGLIPSRTNLNSR